MTKKLRLLAILAAFAVVACGDDDAPQENDTGADTNSTDTNGTDTNGTDTGMDVSEDAPPPQSMVYEFESQFTPGESSVAYGGQTMRHVLISDMTRFVIGLGDAIDSGAAGLDTEAGIRAALDFYFRYSSDGENENIRLSTMPPALQETYGNLGDASILAKLAGNDASRMHRDWSMDFAGWTVPSGVTRPNTPTGYVDYLLDEIARLGALRANGMTRMGPGGVELPPTVTDDGLDLRQLLQKFLLGAVAFSQGADDYLDEGLNQPNTQREGRPYSELEHSWDEGFGYYGAARNALDYTDDEVAKKGGRDNYQGYHDTNSDGRIDLGSEYFFGAAVNAAKRDRGSRSGTDITRETFLAFLEGRAIIASGRSDAAARTRLEMVRDQAVRGWESAIAATAIHYVNDVISDMENIGTDSYNFLDHAKHWAELKGFAFSFQFNPNSPITAEAFVRVHELIGQAPVTEASEVAAATTALLEARTIMGDAFGFNSNDVENW